jgi:hypothetical protein
MDYYPLRYTNREHPDPEEGEEQELPQPVVNVVINDHRENGKSQTFAVKVSVTFPRTKEG